MPILILCGIILLVCAAKYESCLLAGIGILLIAIGGA